MPYDFEADVQLLQGVLSTAAHDLGGLSSALGLRADAMSASLASADAAALRAVTEEARRLGRQLRRLRGPHVGSTGNNSLAPAGERRLSEWITLLQRFGGPVLGRGVVLEPSAGDGMMGAEVEHALTFGALALFHAVRETRGDQSVVVAVRADCVRDAHAADVVDVTIDVRWSGSAPLGELAANRWYLHARSVVERQGLVWHADGEPNDAFVVRIGRSGATYSSSEGEKHSF